MIVICKIYSNSRRTIRTVVLGGGGISQKRLCKYRGEGEGGSKITKSERTYLMADPLHNFDKYVNISNKTITLICI